MAVLITHYPLPIATVTITITIAIAALLFFLLTLYFTLLYSLLPGHHGPHHGGHFGGHHGIICIMITLILLTTITLPASLHHSLTISHFYLSSFMSADVWTISCAIYRWSSSSWWSWSYNSCMLCYIA